jgi:hypothetical protein
MLRKLKLGCAAAVSLLGIAAGAAPAAACGYYGCGGEAVVVQPQPYVAQSCSCCGCGTQAYSYGAYAPAYAAPNYYYRPDYSGYVAAQWGPRLGGYGYRRSWMR